MALALTREQWLVLAAAYALLFVAPAVWMARRARRDGDSSLVWGSLVLFASVLGVLEYYHHRSILRRRAKRAQKAKSGEAHAADRPER